MGARRITSVLGTAVGGLVLALGLVSAGSAAAAPRTGATPPFVDASPATLVFANVPAGSSQTLPLHIFNAGGSPLSIKSITFSGLIPGTFSAGGGCGLPTPPGGTCVVTVTFLPTATTGSENGAVIIDSNASNASIAIALVGSVSGSSQIGEPPPSTAPLQITQISLTSDVVRWCHGCAYPSNALRFQLTQPTLVRVSLQTPVHGRWRQVAITTFHGHAGPNRFRIAGRWRGQLVPSRTVQLLVQTKQAGTWKTHRTLRLTVRSPHHV